MASGIPRHVHRRAHRASFPHAITITSSWVAKVLNGAIAGCRFPSGDGSSPVNQYRANAFSVNANNESIIDTSI